MKNTFTLIISITILLLTVIFTLQNAQVAQVKLLFWDTEASLSLILSITLALGILSAIIMLLPVIFNLKKNNNKLKKEISDFNQLHHTANYNDPVTERIV